MPSQSWERPVADRMRRISKYASMSAVSSGGEKGCSLCPGRVYDTHFIYTAAELPRKSLRTRRGDPLADLAHQARCTYVAPLQVPLSYHSPPGDGRVFHVFPSFLHGRASPCFPLTFHPSASQPCHTQSTQCSPSKRRRQRVVGGMHLIQLTHLSVLLISQEDRPRGRQPVDDEASFPHRSHPFRGANPTTTLGPHQLSLTTSSRTPAATLPSADIVYQLHLATSTGASSCLTDLDKPALAIPQITQHEPSPHLDDALHLPPIDLKTECQGWRAGH